ncbi:MAG: PQQ-binding-like beta-propeller repeat protein [Chloroflexota bacterium]
MSETTQFGGGDEIVSDGSLKANTILMNRYRILGVLGGGGQGYVYSARDLNFPEAKRIVAIKEMRYPAGDPSQRSVALGTFQREANILATLNHPAIPKIFDFFDLNNRAYLVMEYINGSDLELLLSKTKELPMDKIIEWAIDLCDVLHYLHSHQPETIIFRDVKPANIMVDNLGKVRLIDFGIAKKFVSGVKNTMIGTEGYSAPEQYKGDVNPRSDIYSLGATLHHIITRKDPRLEPPFSFNERLLREFNPKAPHGLQAVIDRALQMDPSDRYQNCEEMKQDLLRVRFGSQQGPAASRETDFFNDPEFQTEANIQPKWTFKAEDEIRSSPVSFRNKAIVGSYDHNVWALELASGEFVWKHATEAGIATTPTIDSNTGLVLFGSEDSTFYAVNIETGRIVWSYVTNGRIRSSPRLAHDHVFFGSDDGRVYALVASNGRYLWEYDMGGEVRTRPYVTRELVIAASEVGELVGIELSGMRKWSTDVSKRGRSISSSPFVDETEDICYVGCFDGYLYAVDISNGYTMWRFRTGQPIISSVALDGATLYFGSVDGVFYALNAETAKERWRFITEKPIVASPVVHNGKVYFGGTDSYLYCLDAKTGRELWKFKTGEAITSAPHITEDLILVTSMDHTLYALPLVN